MAYASPEVDRLWGDFALITIEFDNLLMAVRQETGLAPIDIRGPARQPVEDKFDKWKQARDGLQARARSELRKPP